MNLRWLWVGLLVTTGCATTTATRPEETRPIPGTASPPNADATPVSEAAAPEVAQVVPADASASADTLPEAVETLTLEEARALAERAHPRLAVAEQEIRMAQGEALQAGLWPNPVLGLAIDSYTPGSDDNPPDRSRAENALELVNQSRSALQGAGANLLFPNAEIWIPASPDPGNPDQRQDVIGVTQAIPLGGVLGKARTAATKEVERLRAQSAAERLTLRTEVKSAFEEVLYRQRVLEGVRELADTLDQVVGVSRQRFEAGDIAEVEVLRSEASLGRFRVEIGMAEQDLIASESRLAEAMGIPSLAIGTCSGTLEGTVPDIAREPVLEALERHPRTQVRERAQERAAAEIDVAEAGRWPDLSVGVNYRRYAITDQDTWELGVEVELPLFDRNQGAIRRARENLRREELLAAAESKTVRAHAEGLLATYRTNRERVATFERDVLPRMEETLTIAQDAYAAGEVGILEVLDAHRALAEARLSYLRELHELRQSVTELERLTGLAL